MGKLSPPSLRRHFLLWRNQRNERWFHKIRIKKRTGKGTIKTVFCQSILGQTKQKSARFGLILFKVRIPFSNRRVFLR